MVITKKKAQTLLPNRRSMLPDIDGLSICQRVREMSAVPILILSAKDDIETKVAGLDLGANDYLTKPFNSRELFARIRVLLRKRSSERLSENFLQLQNMILYLDRHEIYVPKKQPDAVVLLTILVLHRCRLKCLTTWVSPHIFHEANCIIHHYFLL